MILNKKLENYWLILLSLPSWECGLKLSHHKRLAVLSYVTPFVGVWIEITVVQISCIATNASLPSWECGLKSHSSHLSTLPSLSLPSWECGLKYKSIYDYLDIRLSLPSWECGLKFLSIC